MRKGPWYRNLVKVLPELFSCQYYTELSSQNLDAPLSLKERLVMRFHHIICTVCRRFTRQIKLIDSAARHAEECNHQFHNHSWQLSENAKAKLSNAVNSELSSKS